MANLSIEQGRAVLGRRARVVVIALAIYVFATILTSIAAAGEALGLVRLGAIDGDISSLFAFVAYGLYLIVFLGSAILVAMWIYRAHANLHDADMPALEFTPGWAVGWYFVPIANLFKPLQAMRELWSNSLASSQEANGGIQSHVGPWWAAWLLGSTLSNIASRIGISENGGLFQGAFLIDSLGNVALIAAAVLLAQIVRQVTEAQTSVMGIAEIFA
jgi:hypothetical protein